MIVEATRFTKAWVDFAVGRKGWGYRDDQSSSTHPIAPESLPDSALALLNFDGISYAKGAAVLRQLAAWIGDEAFLAGLREHFETHAFGNATLDDLLGALSRASGRDLTDWATAWLRRAQVNTLRPEVTLGLDGRYETVEVVQTAPPDYPTLRPHRIGIGIYSGGVLTERVGVDLDPSVDGGRTAVPSLVGMTAGEVLLLNDGDLTFAKIRFDRASAVALPVALPELKDSLARALIWAAVVDGVRDAETPMTDLIALCETALPVETESSVFRDVVRFAAASVHRYLPGELAGPASASLAQACWTALDAAEPGDGHQLIAARGLLMCAGEDDVDRLQSWLSGTGGPRGLAIDAELRWLVLGRLVALGAAGEAEIEAEYGRDHTAAGAEHAARCRAAIGTPAAKAEAWRIIMEDDALSNRLVYAAAEGFWQPRQQDLTSSYVERYFAEVPAMAGRRTPNVVSYTAEAAYPRFAVSSTTVELAERLLARPENPPTLARAVSDGTDELRRALAGRELVERVRDGGTGDGDAA